LETNLKYGNLGIPIIADSHMLEKIVVEGSSTFSEMKSYETVNQKEDFTDSFLSEDVSHLETNLKYGNLGIPIIADSNMLEKMCMNFDAIWTMNSAWNSSSADSSDSDQNSVKIYSRACRSGGKIRNWDAQLENIQTESSEDILSIKKMEFESYESEKLALSTPNSRRLTSIERRFLAVDNAKRHFISDRELRVKKMILAKAWREAYPSSRSQLGTVSEALDKIWNSITEVIGDKQRLNIERYNLELAWLQSKSQNLGQSSALLRRKNLDHHAVNGKGRVNGKGGTLKQRIAIARRTLSDFLSVE